MQTATHYEDLNENSCACVLCLRVLVQSVPFLLYGQRRSHYGNSPHHTTCTSAKLSTTTSAC